MFLDERSDQFWQTTNPGGMATSNPFPTRVPVSVSPTGTYQSPPGSGVVLAGDGMIPCGINGNYGPHRVILVPYGTGAATQTFTMNVYAWTGTDGTLAPAVNANSLWIPLLIASYSVTLGSVTGVAATDLGVSNFFANTLTQSLAPTAPAGSLVTDEFLISPTGAAVACICLRTLGARFLEVTFQLGTATGANCLYRKL